MSALIGWIDKIRGIPPLQCPAHQNTSHILSWVFNIIYIDWHYRHARVHERKLLLTFKVQCHNVSNSNGILFPRSHIYFDRSEIRSSQWDNLKMRNASSNLHQMHNYGCVSRSILFWEEECAHHLLYGIRRTNITIYEHFIGDNRHKL